MHPRTGLRYGNQAFGIRFPYLHCQSDKRNLDDKVMYGNLLQYPAPTVKIQRSIRCCSGSIAFDISNIVCYDGPVTSLILMPMKYIAVTSNFDFEDRATIHSRPIHRYSGRNNRCSPCFFRHSIFHMSSNTFGRERTKADALYRENGRRSMTLPRVDGPAKVKFWRRG